jgi:hypothetical protein
MVESIKVIVIVSIVLAVVMGIERLWPVVAAKVKINWKVLVNAGIVILFMMAGYLWGVTGFYEWISEMTGISVER